VPPGVWGPEFTSTVYNAKPDPVLLLADLETARRHSIRLFVSFTGSEQFLRDENGFSMTKWKARVDRFRAVDLSSYIADGTISGHFVLDEPNDRTNWNGHPVPPAQVEEMAKYSKEIWPTLPAIVRAFPDYLKGVQYQYLDAVRVQYLARFGDLDEFISKHLAVARELGLNVMGGLNMLNGGGEDSGMPSYSEGKRAMSPDQLRTFGGRYLREDLCGFILWWHNDDYLSQPGVMAALAELTQQARERPKKSCAD
jgi:hypothetical protein